MELRQLRYFVAVAEREHISDAAAALDVAQSAVSRQIANLEKELGTPLFERVGRNVRLTAIGKIFFEHSVYALKAIDIAVKQVEDFLDPTQGVIKVGFPTSLASYVMPSVISAFKREYPDIEFHLRQGSYRFLIDAVKNRELNLAFLGPLPKGEPDIASTVLFSEQICALVAANHPLAKRESINLMELHEDPFVLFPTGYVLRKLATDGCKQAGFVPNITSVGEDLDALKGLVAAGIGVTLLPESSIYDSSARLTVKVPISAPILQRSVGIIAPTNRELAPSELVFLQFVENFFSHLSQFR